jgi:release factor glutamine methyltransferase
VAVAATTDSIADALGAATDALRAAGIDSPRLDAELLLSEASGIAREKLIADPDSPLDPGAGRRFGEMVRRRLRREPIAYILGRRWFRHIELAVDRRVLIPRPETELLVELGLETAPRRALDVGTGSGAVALALAAELSEVEVVATDASAAALEVAGANAARLGLESRVAFELGTLPDGGGFDLLLANMPYVAEPDWAGLEPEVREWEPAEALLAGADGLDSIRKLLAALAERPHLTETVALEVGICQAEAVTALLAEAGYPRTDTRPDLAGIERVVVGRR